jgi:hypothetical protein
VGQFACDWLADPPRRDRAPGLAPFSPSRATFPPLYCGGPHPHAPRAGASTDGRRGLISPAVTNPTPTPYPIPIHHLSRGSYGPTHAALRVEPRGRTDGRGPIRPVGMGRDRARSVGSETWCAHTRDRSSLRSHIRSSDAKERKRACVNSAHHSYNDRIRLLDKMCSLYVEKEKEEGGEFSGMNRA